MDSNPTVDNNNNKLTWTAVGQTASPAAADVAVAAAAAASLGPQNSDIELNKCSLQEN